MEQREGGDGPVLSPETASLLLHDWLASRKLYPSRRLAEIFAEAGRLAARREPGRHLVSTRLLLLAAGELGTQAGTATDPESRALKAVSDFLQSDIDKLDSFLGNYFDETKVPSGEPAALSANVEHLLEAAVWLPGPDAEPGSVSATSFLLAYPLPGSKAEHLIRSFETTPGQFQAAIRAAVSPPPTPKSAPTSAPTPAPPAPVPAPPAPPSRKTPSKKYNESVSTHTDEPATADQLDRADFAKVLSMRINQARSDSAGRKKEEKEKKEEKAREPAFIVHLHGPWGSGKSSVLNFLQTELETKSDPEWIVVNFNAWRDQRLKPPWWTLITSIYATARAKLGAEAGRKLRRKWMWWRMKVDLVPLLAAAACLALLILVIVLGLTTSVDKLLAIIAGAISLASVVLIGSRSLALGSQRAAQTYTDLKNDPYQPITRLFEDLIKAIGQPVAVFIDDLDRCSADYVVDLLEGIQTLMRGAAVTYVVAADRKWICSSFEQRYSGFAEQIGQPGRPLGYLFLDKMFQISAPLPQPSPEARSSYWLGLLHATPQALEEHKERLADAEREAEAEAAEVTAPEAMQAMVKKAAKSRNPLKLRATRAAMARRVASQEAVEKLEHRLESFDDLVEPNPRAMKRLVNAYAMHQSTLFLSGGDTVFNVLARWTILELRWPLLADFLATRPECVDRLRSKLAAGALPHVPEPLRRLFGDEAVIEVIGARSKRDRLSANELRAILGSVQGDR